MQGEEEEERRQRRRGRRNWGQVGEPGRGSARKDQPTLPNAPEKVRNKREQAKRELVAVDKNGHMDRRRREGSKERGLVSGTGGCQPDARRFLRQKIAHSVHV